MGQKPVACPETAEEIETAVAESGLDRQDWFRDVLTSELGQTENGTEPAPAQGEVVRLEAHLADTKAQTWCHDRLERAPRDASGAISGHREQHDSGTLPAAGESSWWRFWNR